MALVNAGGAVSMAVSGATVSTGPGERRRSRIGVAARIPGSDLEGVAAVGQAAVRGRTRAGGKAAAIELTLKGRPGLRGVET